MRPTGSARGFGLGSGAPFFGVVVCLGLGSGRVEGGGRASFWARIQQVVIGKS